MTEDEAARMGIPAARVKAFIARHNRQIESRAGAATTAGAAAGAGVAAATRDIDIILPAGGLVRIVLTAPFTMAEIAG